jgi:hypothetical protein
VLNLLLKANKGFVADSATYLCILIALTSFLSVM